MQARTTLTRTSTARPTYVFRRVPAPRSDLHVDGSDHRGRKPLRTVRPKTGHQNKEFVPATSLDQAIETANDTDYSLPAAVVTSNPFRGEQVAERINAGMVHVNDTTAHDEPRCPLSGLGAGGGGGKWGPKGAIGPLPPNAGSPYSANQTPIRSENYGRCRVEPMFDPARSLALSRRSRR